jgi:signal transduction histidine kinase
MAFQTALSGFKPPATEIRILDKSGGPVLMEFTIAPHVRGEHVDGVLAIGRDISARRKAEQAQAGLELQLRRAQKMEALGRLAGGVAHDFNNFLTVIKANCQMARETVVHGHPSVECLEEIDKASHHAAELVRQILTFSRPQKQDRFRHHLEPIVLDAIKLLRSILPPNISIASQLATDVPAVLANPEQIHQMLLNLGTNAAYAMRGITGQLELSLTSLHVDEILAARYPDLHVGPYARLTVSDTGHGMDAATIERIFDPFFTTKPPGEGTGLGLAVVHGIMKNHDGTVIVYSEPGRGTRFNLYFPAAAGEKAPPLSPLPLPRGRGEHFLFVDDDDLLTGVGRQMLESLGYRATVCTGASEAIAILRSETEIFDGVISDLAMPGMNGLELAAKCQRLRPGIPFILTSGNTSVVSPESLKACGVREFLLKPFTLPALGETLRRVLPVPRELPCR